MNKKRTMEEYWFWLCSQKYLYHQERGRLLKVFQTPENVYQTKEEKLRESGCIRAEKLAVWMEERGKWDWEKSYHQMEKKGIRFISIEHKEYPERLRKLQDAPFGLFVKGKLPVAERKTVGIVGARRCSGYGKQMAEKLAEALAGQGVQIISGMALGIDGFAQSAAITAGGDSFAVLGCGPDVCYPKVHRALYESLSCYGGIISEYPPDTEPAAWHFPMRNRLISGLSDCILVIEAKERSGSLITADMALEQGKDIYAVPGRVSDVLSQGCNRLIAQGAGIVLSENDLLKELNLQKIEGDNSRKNKNLLETREKLVYSCVDFHARSLNEIIKDVQMPAQEVMTVLTILVMKGYIEEITKNYYIRIN